TVFRISPRADITIYGNGMRIEGSGDRAIDIGTAVHCFACDLVIGPDPSGNAFTTGGVTWDIGSRDFGFARNQIARANTTFFGLTMEGITTGFVEDVAVIRAKASDGAAFVSITSRGVQYRNCWALNGGNTGFFFGSGGGGEDEGCREASLVGCGAIACT